MTLATSRTLFRKVRGQGHRTECSDFSPLRKKFVNTITHEPLHLARWNLATSRTLLNFKVIVKGQGHLCFFVFCVCMILRLPVNAWTCTLATSISLLNIKVIGQGHGFLCIFCLHDTRGQYLALSKAWRSCWFMCLCRWYVLVQARLMRQCRQDWCCRCLVVCRTVSGVERLTSTSTQCRVSQQTSARVPCRGHSHRSVTEASRQLDRGCWTLCRSNFESGTSFLNISVDVPVRLRLRSVVTFSFKLRWL